LYMCKRNELELVKLLVEKGANIHEKSGKIYTETGYETDESWRDSYDTFDSNGSGFTIDNSEYYNNTPLHIACRNNDLETVIYLVEKGANVNEKGSMDDTPLHYACSKKEETLMNYLRDNDIEYFDYTYFNTQLYNEYKEREMKIIKYLIEKGANVNAKNNDDGDTPLHYACYNDNTEIVKYLFEKGANIYEKSFKGDTALHYACDKGILDMIKFLVENGASIHDKNIDDYTPLHCNNENPLIAKYLLKKGAIINEKDKKGMTLLHYASRYDELDMVKYLVKKGANIHDKDYKGKTALLQACKNEGNYDTVEYLIKKGANVNDKSNKGKTPLYYACDNDDLRTFKYLIKKGANINDKYYNGETILHLACKENNLSIIKYLLKHNMSLYDKDNSGNTPLNIIIKNKKHCNLIKNINIHKFINTIENQKDYDSFINALKYFKNFSKKNKLFIELVEKIYTPKNKIIASGSLDVISKGEIKDGEICVDFNNEFSYGRYYTKETYDLYIQQKNINPYTMQLLNNVYYYKAKLDYEVNK
jgi:ankyrin repeat protein